MKLLLILTLFFSVSLTTAQFAYGSTVPLQDLEAKVTELKKTIDELRNASGITGTARRVTITRLVDELTALLKQQREALSNEKAAVAANNNLSSSAKARLSETYDQLIAEVDADTVAYSASNVVGTSSGLSSTTQPLTTVGDGISSAALATAEAPKAAESPTPKVIPKGNIKVCGQLRPASLTQIFAMIGSVSEFPNTEERVLPKTQELARSDAVARSTLTNDCRRDLTQKIPVLTSNGGGNATERTIYAGSQKDATVRTLQTLLEELLDKTNGKARRDELAKGLGGLSEDTIRKQILLLEGYVGNVNVTIESEDGQKLTVLTDRDGNFDVELPKNKKYVLSTEADNNHTQREIYLDEQPLRVNFPLEDRPVSLLSRAVVGYEQAGASSTRKSQSYFFDLFVSNTFPVKQKIDPDFGERFRSWIDFRFASIPQSGESTVAELSSGLATQISGLKVKDVANVFEFLGGFEYRLAGNAHLLPSFDRKTKQKFSLSLIAGGGVTTPTNSLESLTTFKVFPDAPGLPEEAKDKEFVSFVQSDRDRFFRQYFVGTRIQFLYFTPFNMPMQRFPAQLDFTIGQNEFVTGGRMRGPVIRIEGYFPLPFEDMKFLNIFGTALLRPGRSNIGIPLILDAAPDAAVPATNVALIAVPQPNRDYYRVGFGLDFLSFVQKMREALSKR